MAQAPFHHLSTSQPEIETETAKSSPTSLSTAASTTMTTPEQSPGGADDDIWANSSDELDHQHSETEPQRSGGRSGEILSDLPTLRRQHMTSGYREGLSVGKARVMQTGFDEGYPLGVELGLRVGVILGILEGCVAGLGGGEESKAVEKMLEKAREELAVTELLRGVGDEAVSGSKEGVVPTEIEGTVKRWEEVVALLRTTKGARSEMDGDAGGENESGKAH